MPETPIFVEGAPVRVAVNIQVDDVDADPTTLTVYIEKPSGAVIEGAPEQDDAGDWHYDIAGSETEDEAGVWFYYFSGDDPAPGAEQQSFLVVKRRVTVP